MRNDCCRSKADDQARGFARLEDPPRHILRAWEAKDGKKALRKAGMGPRAVGRAEWGRGGSEGKVESASWPAVFKHS